MHCNHVSNIFVIKYLWRDKWMKAHLVSRKDYWWSSCGSRWWTHPLCLAVTGIPGFSGNECETSGVPVYEERMRVWMLLQSRTLKTSEKRHHPWSWWDHWLQSSKLILLFYENKSIRYKVRVSVPTARPVQALPGRRKLVCWMNPACGCEQLFAVILQLSNRDRTCEDKNSGYLIIVFLPGSSNVLFYFQFSWFGVSCICSAHW